MTKIGITPEEIAESMLAPTTNPVKIFVMHLTRHLEINELPWELSLSYDENHLASIQPANSADFGTGYVNQTNFFNKPMLDPDVSSPDGFSLAQRAEWLNMDTGDQMQYDVNQTFEPIFMPLAQLMTHLQQIVIHHHYHFFLPHDLQILGKDDKDTYITIDAVFTTAESIAVHVQMKNQTQEQCEAICNEISQFVSI